jgi:hypothetical protein
MAKKQPATDAAITAPSAVLELVAQFAEQQEDYQQGKYNETQLRRDFLDPFFTAMGWDVGNRKGYAEKFREVIQEITLRVDPRYLGYSTTVLKFAIINH